MKSRQEIFDEIAEDYDVRWAHSKGLNVDFMDVMLDPYHYAFIGVLLMDDKTLLTDFADTAQIIDLSPDEFKRICEKHGLSWNDYYIELEYHSNKDIAKYKQCLIELAEKNWKKFQK